MLMLVALQGIQNQLEEGRNRDLQPRILAVVGFVQRKLGQQIGNRRTGAALDGWSGPVLLQGILQDDKQRLRQEDVRNDGPIVHDRFIPSLVRELVAKARNDVGAFLLYVHVLLFVLHALKQALDGRPEKRDQARRRRFDVVLERFQQTVVQVLSKQRGRRGAAGQNHLPVVACNRNDFAHYFAISLRRLDGSQRLELFLNVVPDDGRQS
mmetsp:Transcript_1267/g.3065  ORF Transcript_1267/g.3065 Transcript_1267/m.3065 type:complete len:210 (-) Transcript_1267:2794-3423(-)